MKTILALLGLIIIGAAAYYFLVIAPAATLEPGTPDTEYTPTMGTPAPGNEGNYPEPTSKLDIDTICTEAVAYMSFPNSVEADAWVAACVRGEHPEAIEEWKRMNGITDDRAI